MKFVGFVLPNDRVSLAGLPQPIHEGVRVLKQVRDVTQRVKRLTDKVNINLRDFVAHVPVLD